jgi:putative endopeptidase
MKSRIIKSLILPLSILTIMNQCNTPNKQTNQTLNDGFDTSSLDLSFRPQDDFDSFANGGWKKRNPIPSTEGSWGAFGILDKENTEVKLKGIIDEVSKNKNNQPNSDEQKIADMYRSFMDTTTIENLALSPLQSYIDQIENIKNLDEWIAVSGELQKIGVANVVGIYVDADDKNSKMNAVKFVQGGLSLRRKKFLFWQ